MDREVIFKEELNYIKNEVIRKDAQYLISLLPEYFFHEAASSGKYHPQYALGEGGLLRHTKAAVRFGVEILQDPVFCEPYTQDEQDVLLLALLLHDGFKRGKVEEKYTRFDHPLIAAQVVQEARSNLKMEQALVDILIQAIKTHMGPWTRDYFGKEVLEKPTNQYQLFVHLCDYLASRKCFQLAFDQDNHIIEK